MATSEQLIPIPGRLHSLAPEGHVAGADEIYDDDLQKSQSEVNALVKEMGASGENHSAGLVPDPGATQGNTKYLREDGTWATPAGQDYTEGNGISISSNAISVKAGSNLSFDASGNLNAEDTTYSEATTSESGLMSSSDKTKLDGIQAGAQVHIAPTANEVKTALGTTSGTTKYLREDGTWQEPAGQNYSAGDGIDINNNEISIDSTVALKTDLAPAKLGSGIGTCSTSSGTALEVVLSDYNLVQNGIVAVTFANDVPAGATLYVNSKGAKPIIYKGSAITADTIKADDTVMFCYDGTNYVVTSLGGGGGAVPYETANISLTQIGGSSSDLIGATVTITNDSTSETILTATWDGSIITHIIQVNTNYTVSVETIEGYLACAPQSYNAGYYTTRNIELQYAAYGVYIEATDGTLYTSSTWASSGKTANSIVILTSSYKRRVALTKSNKPVHNNYTDPLSNYLTMISTSNPTSANNDMDGIANTSNIIRFNKAYNTYNDNYAGYFCENFVFPNGNIGAYIPAQGELNILMNNESEVSACLTACGGDDLSAPSWTISSTGCSSNFGGERVWGKNLIGKQDSPYGTVLDDTSNRVRPFALYE